MTVEEFLAEWHNDSPTVLVHTSGSTGTPKPMLVEKRKMLNSARITCDFLGLKAGDTALLCMSLDYIAGKMMVVRSIERGLRLITIEPCGEPSWDDDIVFAAMVPLQVYNLLQTREGRERLMKIRHLIIGGGAVDAALEAELQAFPHAVWSTYGMTETLSHIALRRLNGAQRSLWYTPFDGVEVSRNDDDCLVIHAPAVHDGVLMTNDIVEMEGRRFRILGRKDNVICSGGIKIQMEEVERLLQPHVHVPYIITRAKDARLGEKVVLLTVSEDVKAIREICQKVLPRYWQPRELLTVACLPMTETGKTARREAERIAQELLTK